jgi:hypothetical protein
VCCVLYYIFLYEKSLEEKERALTLMNGRNSLCHDEPLPTETKGYLPDYFPGASKCASIISII